ncbi:MAG: phosphatase PAP2 family protein [Trichlorobacter sp.]|nr:phosphatase PAP2 family protein [Trichlorobacter sp.]
MKIMPFPKLSLLTRNCIFVQTISLLLLFSIGATLPSKLFAETITTSGELQKFGQHLLDEGKDFVTTPFAVQNNNIFWTLAIAGVVGLTYGFDGHIKDKVQANRSNGLNKASNIADIAGSPYLHIGSAALLYGGGILTGSDKTKETGEMLLEALFLADAATLIFKQGIGRGRPSVTASKGDYKPFQFKKDYDSLPSMHTASSFAMASVLSRSYEGLTVPLLSYTAATFVGFSRVNKNKHWASDVLLGAAIGELAGRVVTTYHADKERRWAIMPAVSTDAATINLVYSY